jgi:hypothetical protein
LAQTGNIFYNLEAINASLCVVTPSFDWRKAA